MSQYDRIDDIPRLAKAPAYVVDVGWKSIENQLDELAGAGGLNLQPDFQRAHVWVPGQQIRFVEYALRGGLEISGSRILFNAPGFFSGGTSEVLLVDGLQRLTAARRFMRGEIPAFGKFIDEYGPRAAASLFPRFQFGVNDLRTRREVLEWYLGINAGGVVHSEEEILRVRGLLDIEIAKEADLDEEVGSGLTR